MIHTTLPRHSTLICWPGSSLLMSCSTGAPAAFARSLGQRLIAKGTAAAAAPMPPTTVVAPIRRRRFLLSTFPYADIPPALRGTSANRASINDLAPAPKAFVQKFAEKAQENNVLALGLVSIAGPSESPMLHCD